MPVFHYTAVDPSGRQVTGAESADSAGALRALLASRGLLVERIDPVPENEQRARVLTEGEAVTMAQQMADIARTGLPLEAGLLALAEETPSRRLSLALKQMARDLQRGESLEQVFAQPHRGLPRHLVELIRAGLARGFLPYALDQYVQSVRRAKATRRRIWLAMSYPLALMAASLTIVLFYLVFVVPEFARIFDGFNTEMPAMTTAYIQASRFFTQQWYVALPLLVLLMVGLAIGLYALNRSQTGRAVICSLPVVGPMLRLTALAEFCQLLGQLLEARTPMPRSLELAGDGCGDVVIAHACRGLAQEVRGGVPLADAVMAIRGAPQLLRQMLRWSDRPQKFAESLLAAAEMCHARAAIQTTVLVPLFEPLAIIFSVGVCGLMVVALFSPLLKLLNDLS